MKVKFREWSFYNDRVQVKIEGLKIDRLIDKAVKNGAMVRDFRMVSETEAVCWVSGKDLKALRKYAKSIYRITLMSEKGIYAVGKRISKRHYLPAGTALVILMVFFQSKFVYSIHIDGYRGIPEEQLRLCLAKQGISEGAYIPDVAWQKARDSIFYTFPQITWVQLVYDGRVVYLNISETDHKLYGDYEKYLEGVEHEENSAEGTEKQETDSREEELLREEMGDLFIPSQKPTAFCNIVAQTHCKIDAIEPIWGEALVKPGDYVEEGQVLISGYIPIESKTYQEGWPTEYYVRAQGTVWAIVPYRLSFSQERYVSSELIERQRQGEIIQGENIVSNKVEKTEEEAKAKANQQIRVWARENLPKNYEIINKGLKFYYKENIIDVGVTLEVRRQIGIEQEIVIGEETTDRDSD